MLFDTDILIWVFRGNRKAADFMDAANVRNLSVISYMELIQGARHRTEIREIKNFLKDFSFQIVPLSENTGHRASVYAEEYGLQVALGIADAIIAASAVENNLVLATGNKKHFSVIQELELKVFHP
jgi:predicted nucleic acid-binding protein